MAGITGQGTTFNLPNYVGTLIQLTPADAPFFSAIGGLTGGRPVTQKLFEYQAYDLRSPENPSNLEGQDAPSARHRVRQNIQNVVQIFHSSVDVSYTKLAATGQRDGLAGEQSDPDGTPANEHDWQVEQELKALKTDIEMAFLTGTFSVPADNATARKTQGILGAITTNTVDALTHEDAPAAGQVSPLTEGMVLDLLQSIWESGGIQESEAATLMAGGTVKRALTKIFVTDKGYAEESRNVGGVNVQTIETDFGKLNIMLSRPMGVHAADSLAVVSLDVCAPRFLLIPGKGFLFVEPLAKTGASEKSQIYGEIGLEYGSERQHGKIENIGGTVV